MPTPKPSYRGYVYLIGSRRFGWFKIGKSLSPKLRIKNLGILLPFKIHVLSVWGTSNHTLLESLMHERYADKAINGEWFSFSSKDLLEIMDQPSPFDGEQIFRFGEKAEYHFSNIRKDVITNCEESLKKTHGAIKGKAFMEKVGEFMKENNLEPTPENKKIARREIARRIKLTGWI